VQILSPPVRKACKTFQKAWNTKREHNQHRTNQTGRNCRSIPKAGSKTGSDWAAQVFAQSGLETPQCRRQPNLPGLRPHRWAVLMGKRLLSVSSL